MYINSILTNIRQQLALVDGKIGDGYTWAEAGSLAISGITIVFLMLVLLVVVIFIFGKIMDNLNGTPKPKKEKTISPQKAATIAKNAKISVEESNEDVVAVIAAAVGYLYSDSGVKPVIRSIKRSNDKAGRSAWATAGVTQNTRAF